MVADGAECPNKRVLRDLKFVAPVDIPQLGSSASAYPMLSAKCTALAEVFPPGILEYFPSISSSVKRRHPVAIVEEIRCSPLAFVEYFSSISSSLCLSSCQGLPYSNRDKVFPPGILGVFS